VVDVAAEEIGKGTHGHIDTYPLGLEGETIRQKVNERKPQNIGGEAKQEGTDKKQMVLLHT
jgi:ribosomal protein L3